MTKTSENQRNIHSSAILSVRQRRLSFFSISFKIQRFFQFVSDDFHFSLLLSKCQRSHWIFLSHRHKRSINDFVFHLLHSFVFVISTLFDVRHFYVLSCSSFLHSFVFVIFTFLRVRLFYILSCLTCVCDDNVRARVFSLATSRKTNVLYYFIFYNWTVKDDYIIFISRFIQSLTHDFRFHSLIIRFLLFRNELNFDISRTSSDRSYIDLYTSRSINLVFVQRTSRSMNLLSAQWTYLSLNEFILRLMNLFFAQWIYSFLNEIILLSTKSSSSQRTHSSFNESIFRLMNQSPAQRQFSAQRIYLSSNESILRSTNLFVV